MEEEEAFQGRGTGCCLARTAAMQTQKAVALPTTSAVRWHKCLSPDTDGGGCSCGGAGEPTETCTACRHEAAYLCPQPREGGEGAVEDRGVQVVVDLQGLLVGVSQRVVDGDLQEAGRLELIQEGQRWQCARWG